MHMCEHWQLHCTSQWGVVDAVEWACVLCGHCIQNDWASKAMNLHQILHEAWTFFHGNYLDDSEGHSYGQLAIGSFIMTTRPLMRHVSCRVFLVKHQVTQVTQPLYSPDLVPCDFWLTFEREDIPDHSWNSGKYNDSWWQLGELCEVPRCLLWRGLRHRCPMYNVSWILYLLQ